MGFCFFVHQNAADTTSVYPETDFLCLPKCNTAVLCQDIQNLVIFPHENAILQCCVRYLETETLCLSKCKATVLCQDIQKLVIFINENAVSGYPKSDYLCSFYPVHVGF